MKWIPDRKVLAGGVSAIVTFLIIRGLETWGKITIDQGTAEVIAGSVGWAMAYLIPPAARDVIKHIDEDLIDVYRSSPQAAKDAATKNSGGPAFPSLLSIVLILMMVAGCQVIGASTPTPQTPRQALVVAEYSYQGAVQTVRDLVAVGTIKGDDAVKVRAMVEQADASLKLARQSVLSGAADAPTYLSAAQQITGQLIQYLEAKKGNAP